MVENSRSLVIPQLTQNKNRTNRRSILEYKRTNTIGYYIKVNYEEELFPHTITDCSYEGFDKFTEKTPLLARQKQPTTWLSCLQTCCCGFSKPFFDSRLMQRFDIWLILILTALSTASLSFAMQKIVEQMFITRKTMLTVTDSLIFQYVLWVVSIICPVWFAVKFVKVVAPQAAGSGIPEIKAIIKGVEVKDFLTFETLLAKIVGLALVSGAGLPIGKEAAFIHVAAIIAILISGQETCVDAFSNELKRIDLLISSCAAGLSSALVSPIGSFLTIIEINSTYFALRHYWHSFYSAAAACVIVSILHSWYSDQPNVIPYFSFNHQLEFSYDGQELFLNFILGIMCGLLGVLYVQCYKKFSTFLQSNTTFKRLTKKYCCLYSIIVTFIIATITFPKGLGRMLAAEIDSVQQINDLFRNFSWLQKNMSEVETKILENWTNDPNTILWSLSTFFIYTFVFSIVASTMPIPNGLLIPSFKSGAVLGRLFGEIINLYFIPVLPGAYAIAGAAAFTSSVTHAVSIAIILIEVTGHIDTILPIIISVVTANSVAFFLSLSLHDTIMLIKGLPYLPNLITCGSTVDNICVDEFMVRDVKFLKRKTTYYDIQRILVTNPKLDQIPLVDNDKNMYLLGSIQRNELMTLLNNHLSMQRYVKTSKKKSRSSRKVERLYPSLNRSLLTASPLRRNPSPDSWRRQQLDSCVDIISAGLVIDPAPFQLVESSSLLQCHALFVMVGIHIAYVTNVGELVGVVGLKELRQAMEDAKKGRLGTDSTLEEVLTIDSEKKHNCSLILETTELDDY